VTRAARILIVEDEPGILLALQDDLTLEGYRVETASDGASGLRLASNGGYDLVILDIMLPQLDGFEVCRRLRDSGVGVPVLMLTAKGQELDKVLGLELGADDYVTKPFSRRELLARVKALLRRDRRSSEPVEVYRFGVIELDFRKYHATKAGRLVDLTKVEYDLLKYLIERRRQAVRRSDILEAIWEDPDSVFPRTVDTHIANLRKKLEDDPARPRHLLSVRGVGYRFAE
jgi:DNA-binding response OmpR family regulator